MPEPPAIDQGDLTEPVRRALDAPDAQVLEWSAEPIAWQDFGGGTRALHRVRGTAQVTNSPRPAAWSMVLKALVRISDDPLSSDDPTDYAYWRREAHFYGSGLLDDSPGGLRAPRCYGVDSRPGRDLVWLEDLHELHPDGWSIGRFELAARHLGRFNGFWLARRELPREPWLSDLESVQEFWTVQPPTQPGLAALLDPAGWTSMQSSLGLPVAPQPTALRAFLIDRQRWLAALSKLPQTLCHHDAMAPNLFAQHAPDGSEDTVAIDWQLCGPGPVGAELALLVAGSTMFLRTPVGSLDELDRRALEGYLAGLSDAGARVDAGGVRFAYAAATVLRMSAIVASWLRNLVEPEDREWAEGFWRRPAGELVLHWAPLVGLLERQASVARDGLPRDR